MNILVDSDIPFITGAFEPHFESVLYVNGASINSSMAKNADALVTRSRTSCNAQLLNGSRVKAIATATVGTDHIDLNYCINNQISVYSAQGCNKGAVLQWVLASLSCASEMLGLDLNGKVFGVVGVGNIGSIVANAAKALGMQVLLCDPPQQRLKENSNFVELGHLAQNSDFISFHVPLTYMGAFPTFGMADENFFKILKRNAVVLNSARGGVVNESMLLQAILDGTIAGAAVDVWFGEPIVLEALVRNSLVATPHIAGYSLEGKINATARVVAAIYEHFSLGLPKWAPYSPDIEFKIPMNYNKYLINNKLNLNEVFNLVYPIAKDSSNLKTNYLNFEEIRNSYLLRRENIGYEFNPPGDEERSKLLNLGFAAKPPE